jgi:streptogramin lyase
MGAVIGVILIGFAATWFVYQKPTESEPVESILNPTPSQNPYLQEYSLPDNTGPNGLIVDNTGTVWVTSSKSDLLYSFDQKSGQLKSYEIQDSNSQYFNPDQNMTMVWTVVQDKDGIIWFSPLGTKSIWWFDPTNDTFNSIYSATGSAFQMKTDANTGDVWFTTLSGDTLCVIEKNANTQSGYKVSAFDVGNDTAPAGLYLQNNSVWVTEITTQKIVEFNIDRENGTVTGITKVKEIPADNQTQLSSPTDLLVNNDSIWLTEHGTSFLTEYNLGNNQIVRYPTSQNIYHATTLPFWIRGINDGKDLWFNEHEGNKLAYFDTVNKTMVEYDIPSRPADGYLTYPLNISTDPSDNMILWFSEWNTDKIAKIDGHVQLPFSISANTSNVILSSDASKVVSVNLNIDGQSPYSANRVFLNASSSLVPDAGFGNLDVKLSPDTLDLSSSHDAQLLLRNYSAPPGNYTLGVSVSNGIVTKTIFLGLVVPNS